MDSNVATVEAEIEKCVWNCAFYANNAEDFCDMNLIRESPRIAVVPIIGSGVVGGHAAPLRGGDQDSG